MRNERVLPPILTITLVAIMLCVSATAAESTKVQSYDCGGVPLIIDAALPSYNDVLGAIYHCPLLSRSELTNIRDSVPWAELGIIDIPKFDWVFDSGTIFTTWPKDSLFNYNVSPCLISIERQVGYEQRYNESNWLESGYPLPRANISVLSNMEDRRFDSETLNLDEALEEAKRVATLLSLTIQEPSQLAYSKIDDSLAFYWLKFPVYMNGLPLHFLRPQGGFPGNGSDVSLSYIFVWGEEGLLSLKAPIISNFTMTGKADSLISSDDAIDALCGNFADHWLPDIKEIDVETMGLSYFSYSSTGGTSGGFDIYPVWYFEGKMKTSSIEDSEKEFSVFINATNGKQIY